MNNRLQNVRPRPPGRGGGGEQRDGKIQREQNGERARPAPIEMELVLFERPGMRKTSVEDKPIFMGHITAAGDLIQSQHAAVDLHTDTDTLRTSNTFRLKVSEQRNTQAVGSMLPKPQGSSGS